MPAKEKRVVLPGSERAAMPGATKVGPADPKAQIQVTVFLRRGTPLKKTSLAQRPRLTRAQFAAAHGAKPERHQENPRVRERVWFEGAWKKARRGVP